MSIYLNSLLLGLVGGFLINYLSDCLPQKRRPTRPLCNQCGQSLPLLAYLTLQQCAHCGERRRWRYLILYFASIFVVYWNQIYPVRLDFWLSLLVFIIFGVITVIDIEYRVVLFETVILGGVIFLLIGVARHGLLSTVLGGGIGFLVMFVLYWLGKLILRLKNKTSSTLDEEALGFGDVNLLTILGFLLGMPAILVALWIAIVSAGIFSLAVIFRLLLLKQYRSNVAIPYAPFLIFGAFALLYLVRP